MTDEHIRHPGIILAEFIAANNARFEEWLASGKPEFATSTAAELSDDDLALVFRALMAISKTVYLELMHRTELEQRNAEAN